MPKGSAEATAEELTGIGILHGGYLFGVPWANIVPPAILRSV